VSDSPPKRLRHQQVTLYSLLVLVAVVLIVGAFFAHNQRECESNLARIAEALEAYKTQHGAYPDNHHQLVPEHIEALPSCPSLDLMTYRTVFGRSAGYGDPASSDYFIIRCTGQEHGTMRGWFPAYDNVHGLLLQPPGEIGIRQPESIHRGRTNDTLMPCKSNLKSIGTAMEMYSVDYGGRYPQNFSFLTPNYLREIPECQETGHGSLGYFVECGEGATYNSEGFRDYYFIECVGTGHGYEFVPRNYPQYDAIQGIIDR
jgi:hypothetical protein